MVDVEEGAVETNGGQGDTDPIVYDFYKFLTSLCVFSLGGVLALADKIGPEGRGKELLVGALIVICIAGLFAFTAVGEIVRARSRGEPLRPGTRFYQSAAGILLAFGLGMFTYLFVRSLFK